MCRFYENYNVSRLELEVAAENFQEGVEDWVAQQTRRFIFGFTTSMVKLSQGDFPCGAAV